VHRPARGERGVHYVADEHVHHAVPAAPVPEQLLGLDQGTGMAVDPHRQARHRGEQIPGWHVPPSQRGVVHHDSGHRIDPAPGGDAQPQWLARRVLGREIRDPPGDARQHVGRWPAAMRVRFPGDDPAAQVDHGQGGCQRADVQAADGMPFVTDVHRHVRTADAVAATLPGYLPHQSGAHQVRAVAAGRGRAQPGETGDGASWHRAVVQDGVQHVAGARRPAPVGRGRDVRPAQRGSRSGRMGGHRPRRARAG
jgi:hypothetical protein